MAQGRQLVWVEKCYFKGWTCSACLWRSEGFRWNYGGSPYPGIRTEFEAHDCAYHQSTEACPSVVAFDS